MSNICLLKVRIELINGEYFVWNPDDVQRLRDEFRIVGCLVGCSPVTPHQNERLGLPLKLSQEEVLYLVLENHAASVFRRKSLKFEEKHEVKRNFNEFRKNQKVEQSILCHKDKIAEQLSKVDDIAKGRLAKDLKKKANPGISTASILRVTKQDMQDVPTADYQRVKEEVEKEILGRSMKLLNDDQVLVEIFDTFYLESPFDTADDFEEFNVDLPFSDGAGLKYAVFKKLHDEGNYLSNGFKFGGDFLSYPGDPSTCHADQIVVILDSSANITDVQRFSYCRLGSQVKKDFLLCSWNEHKSDILVERIRWGKTKPNVER